jgi:hypothetical protein
MGGVFKCLKPLRARIKIPSMERGLSEHGYMVFRLPEDIDNLFRQRVDDTVMHFNTFSLPANDPFVLQKGQMLGNRCLGKFEAFPDMLYVAFLGAQPRHDLESHRMPQDFQNFRFRDIVSILVKFHVNLPFTAKKSASMYISNIMNCQEKAVDSPVKEGLNYFDEPQEKPFNL